jgi:hypothetical protein
MLSAEVTCSSLEAISTVLSALQGVEESKRGFSCSHCTVRRIPYRKHQRNSRWVCLSNGVRRIESRKLIAYRLCIPKHDCLGHTFRHDSDGQGFPTGLQLSLRDSVNYSLELSTVAFSRKTVFESSLNINRLLPVRTLITSQMLGVPGDIPVTSAPSVRRDDAEKKTVF